MMLVGSTPRLLDLSSATLPLTTRGSLESVRHGQKRPRLRKKRWYYLSAANATTYLGCSIVDLGYMAKGFVYVASRDTKRMLAHHEALLPPGPWCRIDRNGDSASGGKFIAPTLQLRFVREVSGSISVRGSAKGLDIALVLSPTGEPLVAANTPAPPTTIVTEKAVAYRVRGGLEVDGQRFDMSDASGASDYTDGYLPRRTLWKWASVSTIASGRSFGMNLVQGYMGACECFAMIDGEITTLGEGVIDRPPDPMEHWRVRTSCGRVDLSFAPFAIHRDDTDLRLVHAKFEQPIGVYSGRVLDVALDRAIGVCEDQDVLW